MDQLTLVKPDLTSSAASSSRDLARRARMTTDETSDALAIVLEAAAYALECVPPRFQDVAGQASSCRSFPTCSTHGACVALQRAHVALAEAIAIVRASHASREANAAQAELDGVA